jgi:lambda family phage tail tape measure protein
MADLRYSIDVNTAQAERNLAQLQKTVAGVNNAFAGLKAALAGISLGAIIGSSIRMAAAMNDLSGNTNIAISSILGLSRAIVDNGGSAEVAQKGIQKFAQSIGAAVDGSTELQRAFGSVGVSIKDLATLSETDLLAKTVAGLGRVEDSTKRIRLQTQMFGKDFGQVNMAGAASGFAASVAASARYEAAIRSAGAAQDKINENLQNFQIAILKALKPINDLVAKINVSSESFERFITAVLAAVAALLSITAAIKVWNLLKLIGAALVAIYTSAKASAVAVGGFIAIARLVISDLAALSTYSARWKGILIVIQGIKNVISSALAPAFASLKLIAMPVLGGIAAYWGWIQKSTSAAIDKLREYASALTFGLISAPNTAGGGRGDGQAELEQRRKDADEKKRLADIVDKMAKRRAEIQKASQAFKDQNDQILNNIILEKRFIGQSEEFIELERAREEVFSRATAETSKLREAKKLLTKDESELASVYDQQIAKISAAAQVDAARIAGSITNLQGLRLVEQGRLQDIENTTQAIEAQMARQQALGDIIRQANQKAMEATDRPAPDQLVGLSNIQRQILDIQESARNAAIEAGRAFAANFEDDGDGLTPERARELAQGLDQIAGAYKRVADAQIGLAQTSYDSARLFETGWKDAFTKFKEDALDSGKQAANSFTNFTSRMEDAFVKFAQTGKLSFKDLANSIIADLVRIAVRRAIVAAVGGPLGMLFGGGRSAGGSVAGGTSYVVGERGPELFVPTSAGKIVSNAALKGSGSSAGNAGGGGQTVVNYNIQAVDASSFRSLVAKDPSFIYAVTEQGRRSQPTRSR